MTNNPQLSFCEVLSAAYSGTILFFRGHSSVGRAPALQAGCQGFESPCLHAKRDLVYTLSQLSKGPVAQLVRACA